MIPAKQKILHALQNHGRQVDRLLHRLEGIDDGRLNRRPAEGGWSALQTLHHLLLAEALSLHYVQKKLVYATDLEPSGWRHRFRSMLVTMSLRSPLRFRAPATISAENLPEQSTLGEVREQWQVVRTDWTRFLQDLPDDVLQKAVYRHPRAGRLTWAGMLAFFRAHLSRHTRQIERALREVRGGR
jgi:uncharacterized damage-inducible protein DinB